MYIQVDTNNCIRVPMVMVFDEALAGNQNAINPESSTTDHVIASDFRLSTGQRQATGHLTMSRDVSRDDRCSTWQCNVWCFLCHTER